MYTQKILLPAVAGGLITLILLIAFPQLYRSLEWRFATKSYIYHKAVNDYLLRDRHLLRLDENLARHRLIFIGDSQIKNMDTSGFTPRAINFGIQGDTWLGISQRTPHYTSLNHAGAIIFFAGINDLKGNSIPSILQQVKIVIKRNYSPTLLYIVSVLSVDTNKIPIALDDIQSLNEGLAKICKTKCIFINAYNSFLNIAGTANTGLLKKDGIHLNYEGYELLKATIQLSIDKMGK